MKYPMFKVHIDVQQALSKLEEVLSSGFLNEGVQVTEFTKYLENYFEHDYVIPLNSGTSALTLALKLAGVEKDDEVITTSMTCIATNTPIHALGAKVVWADIDRYTGNIDPTSVKKLITKKTKAVMCVNWAGLPCQLDQLQKICKDARIKLIQDAAHGFGSTYKGKQVCHSADFTCYSLQAIKHITTGDGGILVCNNSEDYERARKLKWFGIDREATKDANGEWKGQRWEVDIQEAGYKFHMNNIAAAIGLSQIPHVDRIVSTHTRNAQIYRRNFAFVNDIEPLLYPTNSYPSYWVMTCLLDEVHDRDAVILKLRDHGIDVGVVHTPNHYYTCFAGSKKELPETEWFSAHQISLPCGWWLTEDDINFISNKVIEVLNETSNQ